MKGVDIFCESQASTTICHSMDQPSSSSATVQLGGRAIDRYNPIIRDGRRTPLATPCSSQPPISPKPQHHQQKSKKTSSSSSKQAAQSRKDSTKGGLIQKKKSGGDEKLTQHIANNYSCKPIESVLRRSWVRPPADLFTPPGSSRYLLGETSSLERFSDRDPVLAITPVDNERKDHGVHLDETKSHTDSEPSSSSRPKSSSSNQVVDLKVSLHCKGCEGKVRKHLSRMQGVTSFNIDFKAKKVTVVGDVTPLSVLASISKVKNAQIWPASLPSETKK